MQAFVRLYRLTNGAQARLMHGRGGPCDAAFPQACDAGGLASVGRRAVLVPRRRGLEVLQVCA